MIRQKNDESDEVLTSEEKETIIRFDQTQTKAIVFTYNLRWQKHLENRVGLKPITDNGYGGKEYEIDKKYISKPRAPRTGRKFTEEQRAEAKERLSKARKIRKLNKVKQK